jgi:hypothetical protein
MATRIFKYRYTVTTRTRGMRFHLALPVKFRILLNDDCIGSSNFTYANVIYMSLNVHNCSNTNTVLHHWPIRVINVSRHVSDVTQKEENSVALWWNSSVKTDIKIMSGYWKGDNLFQITINVRTQRKHFRPFILLRLIISINSKAYVKICWK